jgi:hypothetical protein
MTERRCRKIEKKERKKKEGPKHLQKERHQEEQYRCGRTQRAQGTRAAAAPRSSSRRALRSLSGPPLRTRPSPAAAHTRGPHGSSAQGQTLNQRECSLGWWRFAPKLFAARRTQSLRERRTRRGSGRPRGVKTAAWTCLLVRVVGG